tara:strand:+ start:462 stop:707 length:246 start_codon:yes stop_codon:yes gene_type:complete
MNKNNKVQEWIDTFSSATFKKDNNELSLIASKLVSLNKKMNANERAELKNYLFKIGREAGRPAKRKIIALIFKKLLDSEVK